MYIISLLVYRVLVSLKCLTKIFSSGAHGFSSIDNDLA